VGSGKIAGAQRNRSEFVMQHRCDSVRSTRRPPLFLADETLEAGVIVQG
jgi:hypothetical protein